LWLETQNVNFPAIQFYTKLGFQFCGFDTTLYNNSETNLNEVAFYFFRFILKRRDGNSRRHFNPIMPQRRQNAVLVAQIYYARVSERYW
jgi:hypothetical protein